jgi:hypothetical protein
MQYDRDRIFDLVCVLSALQHRRQESLSRFRKGRVKVRRSCKGPVKVLRFRKGPVKVRRSSKGPVKLLRFCKGRVKVRRSCKGRVKVCDFVKVRSKSADPVKAPSKFCDFVRVPSAIRKGETDSAFRPSWTKLKQAGSLSGGALEASSPFQTARPLYHNQRRMPLPLLRCRARCRVAGVIRLRWHREADPD